MDDCGQNLDARERDRNMTGIRLFMELENLKLSLEGKVGKGV
jgi:hypothetical protein